MKKIINTSPQKKSYGKRVLQKLSKIYTRMVFFRDASSANMIFLVDGHILVHTWEI